MFKKLKINSKFIIFNLFFYNFAIFQTWTKKDFLGYSWVQFCFDDLIFFESPMC